MHGEDQFHRKNAGSLSPHHFSSLQSSDDEEDEEDGDDVEEQEEEAVSDADVRMSTAPANGISSGDLSNPPASSPSSSPHPDSSVLLHLKKSMPADRATKQKMPHKPLSTGFSAFDIGNSGRLPDTARPLLDQGGSLRDGASAARPPSSKPAKHSSTSSKSKSSPTALTKEKNPPSIKEKNPPSTAFSHVSSLDAPSSNQKSHTVSTSAAPSPAAPTTIKKPQVVDLNKLGLSEVVLDSLKAIQSLVVDALAKEGPQAFSKSKFPAILKDPLFECTLLAVQTMCANRWDILFAKGGEKIWRGIKAVIPYRVDVIKVCFFLGA